MPAVYGSATIANPNSVGNGLPVQDMIGNNKVNPAINMAMQNGHIGAGQTQIVTPEERAEQIAADGTPGIKSDASDITWSTATGTWS